MQVGLHDAEKEYLKHKTFPNYALMKISAYHKARGDSVEWWTPLLHYDIVYSSKIFDFTPENPYLPPDAIRGGTGYTDIPISRTLPLEIDAVFPDYSIYPECDYAIGYITRGCPNNCPWCVVPAKEGGIKPYRTWKELVRPDTNKLVLMDNNILACEYGITQLESLIGSGYAIDLNQGMDARLVDERIASQSITERALSLPKLTTSERQIINELLISNDEAKQRREWYPITGDLLPNITLSFNK